MKINLRLMSVWIPTREIASRQLVRAMLKKTGLKITDKFDKSYFDKRDSKWLWEGKHPTAIRFGNSLDNQYKLEWDYYSGCQPFNYAGNGRHYLRVSFKELLEVLIFNINKKREEDKIRTQVDAAIESAIKVNLYERESGNFIIVDSCSATGTANEWSYG